MLQQLQCTLISKGSNKESDKVCVPHPDCGLVAAHTVDGQPGGQVQQTLQNLLVQLQVGQLPLPLQSAQVDLVWRQVLSEPAWWREKGEE